MTSSASGGVCAPGESESCYSGEPATEGIGDCVAGTRTCLSDGSFGPCNDEVVPTTEDCATPADEDCDGATPTCDEFAKIYVGAEFQGFEGVAVRPNGHPVVGGWFYGHTDFGTVSADSLGETDALVGSTTIGGPYQGQFVATLESDGTVIAARGFPGFTTLGRPGFDALGNVVVGSAQIGTYDWGLGPQAGGLLGPVILRLRLDLSLISVSVLEDVGGRTTLLPSGRVAANGDVAFTGMFSGTSDFGEGPVVASGYEIYLQRLDRTDSQIWARTDQSGLGYGVNFDAMGGMVSAGVVGDHDFGGTSSPVPEGLFVARFDAEGVASWATSATQNTFAANGAYPNDIVASPSGHTIVTGNGIGDLQAGSTTLALSPDAYYQGFVLDVDPTGAITGAREITSGPMGGWVRGVALGPAGEVYVAGSFQGSLLTPSGSVPSQGLSDAYIYKIQF